MPIAQHFQWVINLFHKFADFDNDPESVDREEGSYLDAQNMRNTSLDGHAGSLEKIHGETIFYPNIDNRCIGGSGLPFSTTYTCIADYQVLGHLVEFWADENHVLLPYVRVDGWVVLMGPTLASFPISTLYPPQVHGNNSCVGGEIFYTDNQNPPFILNIADLLENSGVNPVNNLRDDTYTCTTKYFAGFNIQQYQVQPPSQQDHPQFVEIVLTGSTPNTVGSAVQHGTGGMKVGQYQYAIQYVDSSGNTSNWSELTPLIPVPAGLNYSEPIYPSTNVYGGEVATVSALGIHVRFRVTNLNNFASINVRRTSWNVNASLGTLPNDDSVIATINIANGQVSIIDFYDYDNSILSPITQSASTQSNLSSIQAAKGIRYYQSKLTLWNITYASRDLGNAGVSFDTTNNTMYPLVRPLGAQGYKDIWNDVYRKSYFRGERYGFALVAFDNDGNPTFAIPIPGSNASFPSPNTFANFQMPNRRDQLSGPSLAASVEVSNSLSSPVPLTTAANSANSVTTTYEVFDQSIMVQRDGSTGLIGSNPKTIIADSNTPNKTGSQNPVGYNVFHPIKDSDTSNSFSYLPTVAVNDVSTGDPSAFNMQYTQVYDSTSGVVGGWPSYNPKGFMPNMYALGMVLSGVSNLPNWVSAFAIVRTAPANRVLAQGQGYYNFNPSGNTPPGYNSNNTNKDTNGMLWDSPDFLHGIAPVNTILSNTSRYKMQLVSPVGMFSEVYHGYASLSKVVSTIHPIPNTDGTYDSEIDMISYCRIIQDNGNFNPTNSPPTMAGISSGGLNYTSFNSWRNSANSVTPNEEFPIGYFDSIFPGGYSVTAGSSPRRSCYYWKSSGAGIYSQGTTNGDHDYVDTGVRNWHEPLYVTNVVDDTQNVTQGLIQDYFQTGCYIKTVSVIGQIASSTNGTPSFVLVDERWQDCIPAERIIDATANQDRYVWIQDVNNNQFAWLNVTYKTSAQIAVIQAAIAANGFYVSTRTCGNTTVSTNCYGIYSHSIVTYTNGNLTSSGEKFYYINFDQQDNAGNNMIPAVQSFVIVKYDACAPIEVFGGDTFIGDYTYPVADCVYDSDANPLHSLDQFVIDRPLPYRAWEVNENTLIVHNNDPTFGSLSIQQNNVIRLYKVVNIHNDASYVRQLMCNGIVESRTNTALMFSLGSNGNSYVDSFFPNVNYVMRPIIWRKWSTNIQGQFTTDYPDENTANNLGYGGFRVNPNYTFDYSEYPTQDKSYSKPTSGFKEQLNFCTRVLWSDTRTTNEQNSPNLRNFPSTNIYDFDDAQGEIKRAWDSSNAGQQGNLYAHTQTGVVMAETNKAILSTISGGQLSEIGNSENTFIQAEVWLSRSIGMPDQMWRSAAEYSNKIYWADKMTVYRLENNEIADIGTEALKYSSSIKNLLSTIEPGYGSDVTAVWNEMFKEYWLCINPHRVIASNPNGYGINMYDPKSTPIGNYIVVKQDQVVDIQSFLSQINAYTINPAVVNEFYIISSSGGTTQFAYATNSYYNLTPGVLYRVYFNAAIGFFALDTNYQNLCNDLIWAEQDKGWGGQYKYRFDKYTMDIQGNVYGTRSGATWLLESGFIQNGKPVQAWVTQSANPKEGYNISKEFIRIRVNSNNVPDNIVFYQNVENYMNAVPHSNLNGFPALKNYGGNVAPSWEGYVPRGDLAPYYRNQGRYTIYQIFYAKTSEFWLSSSALQWKPLK